MGTLFFTSDLHFNHKSILNPEYTERDTYLRDHGAGRLENTPDSALMSVHNEWIVDTINERVGPTDHLYFLGDIAFGSKWETAALIDQINGHRHLVLGNHDSNLVDFYKSSGLFETVAMYAEVVYNKKRIILFHYPIAEWNAGHYSSWMLHGHCVDMETEILTKDGWKFRADIQKGDIILNVDPATGKVVEDYIGHIVDRKHTGDVVCYSGKSVDFRVTDEHMIVGYARSGEFKKFKASEFRNAPRFGLIRAGKGKFKGINLSDDMLRLYVYCVADGNLKHETDLWRIRVKKPHKVKELTRVLTALDIDYKVYESVGHLSFNFYVPKELFGFEFKGLDEELRDMTRHQFNVLMDAYSLSDGSRNGNGVLVTTAKECEANLLSELAVVRGWGCTILRRENHGFGKLSWQLSLFPADIQLVSKPKTATVERVKNEPFWCVITANGNFFMRRNGKIHVTGNCHGNFDYEKAGLANKRILDVGWDNSKKAFGFYGPISFEQVHTYMQGRESITHHGQAD